MISVRRQSPYLGFHKEQTGRVFEEIILFRGKRKPIFPLIAHLALKNDFYIINFEFAYHPDIVQMLFYGQRQVFQVFFGDQLCTGI